MIVVPAVAQCDDSKEVVVDAVVCHREIPVPNFGNVAHDVQNQRHIPSQETGEETGEHYFRAEASPEQHSEENPKGNAFYVS